MRTLASVEDGLKHNDIIIQEALYHWTSITCKQTLLHMSGYSDLIKKYLHQVEWLPEGEKFLVDRITPVYWHSPEDFFKFVNGRFGGMFEFGDFLRGYIDEKDLTKAQELLRKQTEKIKNKQRNAELKETKTQRERSKILGVPKSTINRWDNLPHNVDKHTKTGQCKRTNTRQVYLSESPETAAQKIREKFGEEFAQQLKELL